MFGRSGQEERHTLHESKGFSIFYEEKRRNIRGGLYLGLVPRTEPIMATAMSTTASRLSGMMYLFFRYHGRLEKGKQNSDRNVA